MYGLPFLRTLSSLILKEWILDSSGPTISILSLVAGAPSLFSFFFMKVLCRYSRTFFCFLGLLASKNEVSLLRSWSSLSISVSLVLIFLESSKDIDFRFYRPSRPASDCRVWGLPRSQLLRGPCLREECHIYAGLLIIILFMQRLNSGKMH